MRMLLGATLAVATLLASWPVPLRAQSIDTPNGTLTLPAAGTTVSLSAGLRPIVAVTINGHGPFRMLVETGSAASYLLPENYARVFSDRATTADTVRIGSAILTGILLRRRAQLGVPGIDGLLGLDALFDAAVTFDFSGRELRFTKDTLPAANDRDVLTLGATSQLWTVPITLGDRRVRAILDTQSALSAFEVKLGLRDIDVAAEHLLRLAGRIDTQSAGEPLALAVITATGHGYVRHDGVAVIPIGALTA